MSYVHPNYKTKKEFKKAVAKGVTQLVNPVLYNTLERIRMKKREKGKVIFLHRVLSCNTK